jgi:hypothetical protein
MGEENTMIDRLIVLLPSVVMLLYIATAVAFLVKKQPSWALVYFAYSLANVGLIWASVKA